MNQQTRIWYQNHKEEKKAKSKLYRQTHKEQEKHRYASWRATLKQDVFSHYSNGTPKCAICGETNLQKLALDHIDGRGQEHRQIHGYTVGTHTWSWAKKNNYPAIFQVLCRDCNFIKTFPLQKLLLVAESLGASKLSQAKERSLRNGITLLKADLSSRFNAIETTEINKPSLLRNFWFRQQKNTLSELIERINQLEQVFGEAFSEDKGFVHPSRKQLSEDAFCLRNFDDEETKSKCESECIFGKKHFDLSLCRHVKNQDLVIRTSKFGKLLSGSEEIK